jgi:hypothetical protein
MASVEAAKMPCRHQADHQHADSNGEGVGRIFYSEVADVADECVPNGQIQKSPQHIHRRGGKSFPRRLCKRALEGLTPDAADEMRHGVGEKSTAEEPGDKMQPCHIRPCLDYKLGEPLQQFHRCREFGLFMVRQLRLQSA